MGNQNTQAANVTQCSIALPITTGLIGSDNSAKTFFLNMPSGVTSTSIVASTLRYNGNNVVIGNPSVENGKIKITLKGTENIKTLDNIEGYRASYTAMYTTTIYNSIWLYSDGRRWQINEYDENNNRMKTKDVNAADGYPSRNPPRTVVTAGPFQDKDYLKWYNGSATEVIDSADIIQSSITPVLYDNSPYVSTPPKFKNGRIIINYYIPNLVPYEPEPNDGLSGKAEGRKYFAYASYYYKATAKLTTYSYGGVVTLDYNLPTEPTLTSSVTILKPNPNPTRFENTDVPVQLSLMGTLAAYTDTSNISEWVFYAKEKGVESTLQTKKDYTKTLTSNRPFDFIIPKLRITSDNYRQEYDLTVTVRFTRPVVTSTGTINSLSERVGAIVEVYKNTPTIEIPPPVIPNASVGKPPVAVIMVPDTVKAGEEFVMSGGGSYDPDGTIKDYSWNTPGIGDIVIGSHSTTWYPVSSIGENNIGLTVTDNEGMTGSTGKFITVIEPLPEARLQIQGTKKQNRKVTLHSTSTSPTRYPLKDELTRITISAVSGGTSSDIKYSGSLDGVKDKDVLFKQPGTYKATIYVENTLGYSATNSITFDIQPDKSPMIYFSLQSTVYRNPDQGNKAIISIDDMSFSPDSDLISRRLWEYRYDSDNDGTFEDEPWIVFSDANLHRLNLEVNEVGKYEVKVTEFEEFGQPTIDEFVTAGDRKSASSYTSKDSQPLNQRVVDVKNRAPQGDWAW
ncbi:MAG: PKD domain-containing protein [Paenibacillus sp.]|nr:PKD domain-containing protein [Paenibacillus sp.]